MIPRGGARGSMGLLGVSRCPRIGHIRCTSVAEKVLGKQPKLAFLDKKPSMVHALPMDDRDSHQKRISLRKTFSVLIPELKTIAVAAAAIGVSSYATIKFYDTFGVFIDLLASPTESTVAQLQSISLQLTGILAVGAVATFAHTAMLETTGQKVGAQTRMKLFRSIMSQDVAFHRQNRAGELANRLSTDVHEVAEHLVENVATFLERFMKAVGSAGAMWMISPMLTVYSGALIPTIVGGAMLFGKFIKRLSRKHLDALATSTHIAAERFGGFGTVLLFGQTEHEIARYNSIIARAYTLARKVAVWQGAFLGSSHFAGSVALLGVLWLGGKQVLDGSLTAGQLTNFCMLANLVVECVRGMTESTAGFLRAQGSGTRLFALLEKAPSETQSGTRVLPKDYTGRICFENVSFAYPDSPSTLVVRNLSLTVNEGELLALTGRSGCGKSSLMLLLQRLYEPTEGRITLDGVDIRDLDVRWLRSQIGSVQQEPALFAATVRENIAYGKPDATQEEIEDAARQANVHENILSLARGYDTIVGERGASLSGGQKQRIAIARALLTGPRILALDEATSALDIHSEQLVLQSLAHLRSTRKMTTVVIAHHLSTLAASDRVAVLDEGLLMEDGSFNELSQRTGVMQQLVHAGSVHPPHSNCPPELKPKK